MRRLWFGRAWWVAVGLLACSSPPPPQAKAPSEPKLADDVPTWCEGSGRPCVPPADFVEKMCRGHFAGVGLFMHQKQSPWQRRWVKSKNLAAKSLLGGSAGSPELEFAEELILLREGAAAKGAAESAPVVMLRWDGHCVSVTKSDAVTYMTGTPKSALVDWSLLEPAIQRALLENPEVARTEKAHQKECESSSTSEACQKASKSLSNAVALALRRGQKLPMPQERP
jgi:hypothetical protein